MDVEIKVPSPDTPLGYGEFFFLFNFGKCSNFKAIKENHAFEVKTYFKFILSGIV